MAAIWQVTGMRSIIIAFAVFVAASFSGAAQEFSGLARVIPDKSTISDDGRQGVRIDLSLSLGVPYRLFTLTGPPRLVADFREVDWTGLSQQNLLSTDRIETVKFGSYVPGWSRLVAELSAPMAVQTAEMQMALDGSGARLTVHLTPVSEAEFLDRSGAPYDPRWDLPEPSVKAEMKPDRVDDVLVVMLDPGHGGIDPGAETDRSNEKTLMQVFARELREVLLRSGNFDVFLTRDGDYFVSLEQRVALAHDAGADVFLSLHADSLAEGKAHGATIHVLSEDASDVATAMLAERHDRDQLLSGVDLNAADDRVAGVLLDLARQETQPRTQALARSLVDAIGQTGAPVNRVPLRSGGFSVLKAADIPSVLIEIGFMSSPRDLKNLRDPAWRARMAEGIRNGLEAWRKNDAAIRPLVRR